MPTLYRCDVDRRFILPALNANNSPVTMAAGGGCLDYRDRNSFFLFRESVEFHIFGNSLYAVY